VNRVVILLSSAVRRAPAVVLLVAFGLTVALGAFIPQIVQGGGNEGFSPDNPELLAQQRAAEAFGSGGDVVLQVLLRADEGVDVISPTGVAAVVALEEGLRASPQADLLVDRPDQPPVASPLGPVLRSAAEAGIDPTAMGDDEVDQRFAGALAQLPPEQLGFVTGLLPDAVDPADAESGSALAIVFLDADALPEDDIEAAEQVGLVADVIEGVDVPGVALEPFAFQLLFAGNDDFAAEIGRLFGMALLIIVIILAFVYVAVPREDGSWVASTRRTAADVGLTMLVVLMAIVWVQGAAGLLGPNALGLIDALAEPAQILPVLLIGLGVDYGIHLTARYRDEVGRVGVTDAVVTATRTVGVALVLATVTTAIGFLTNVVSPVPALRDFGILAAIGITAAFLMMLTVFPAARLLLDRRAEAAGRLPVRTMGSVGDGVLPRVMGKLAVLAERAAVPTLVVTMGFGGILGGIGLANVSTEFSFTDFLPEDDPLILTFDTIVEDFGGGFGETTAVVIDGPPTPAVHNALVEAGDALIDVDGVVAFGDRASASSPATVLGQVLTSLAPPVADQPAGPGSGGTAQPVDPQLAAQIAALVDPGALTVPADADVEALYALLLQAAPAEAGQVISPDQPVTRVIISTDAGESGADELALALTELYAPVSDALGDAGDAVATSDAIVSTRITDSLRDSQLQSLFIAVLAAMVLLVISFGVSQRRPFLGVITILPVALIVLWTFGMMAATGVPVGPVTATIAALAVGIGVPYTIHVTNRWNEDRLTCDSPETAIRSTVSHTGGALAGSAFTTIAGFGILTTSSLTPFQQFGLVTVYAIGFALVAATIVLPSMLVLYDRWLRRRAAGSSPRRAIAVPPPPPPVRRPVEA
jgi:uncharacterized protein